MMHPTENEMVRGLFFQMRHEIPNLAVQQKGEEMEFSFWKADVESNIIIVRKSEGKSWSLYFFELATDKEYLLEHYETVIDMIFSPDNVYRMIIGQLMY